MATKIPFQFVAKGHKKVEGAMGGIGKAAKQLAIVLGPVVLAGALIKLGKNAITTAGE